LVYGGQLNNLNWRTFNPGYLLGTIESIVSHRLA
jgi:hypothetical protein